MSSVWINPGTNAVYFTAGTGTTSTTTSTTTVTTAGGNTCVIHPMVQHSPTSIPVPYIPDHIKLEVGKARIIRFPDGTRIDFKEDGSFKIEDKDAKVVYKASIRDFNPFLNASDKLEEFIQYCGSVGVRQGDMLEIPIKHFVQWLVIEAARADGESIPEVITPVVLALQDYSQSRCRSCGRFMSQQLRADRIEFCRPVCLEMKLNSHRSKRDGYQTATQINQASTQTNAEINGPSEDAAASI